MVHFIRRGYFAANRSLMTERYFAMIRTRIGHQALFCRESREKLVERVVIDDKKSYIHFRLFFALELKCPEILALVVLKGIIRLEGSRFHQQGWENLYWTLEVKVDLLQRLRTIHTFPVPKNQLCGHDLEGFSSTPK